MSKVDWSAMTAREVWDSLRARPRLVMGPWEERENDDCSYWVRESINGTKAEWYGDGRFYMGRIIGRERQYESRASVDAWLVREGWLLVDDPAPPEPPR